MSQSKILVTLRIPGTWSNPLELFEGIPADCELKPDLLIMADGSQFEVNIREADDQFVSIFASSSRREPTAAEKDAIENYTVQVCLTGPGGSEENATALMRAASAILHAGGSGVFIDNCGLAFGATTWREMAETPGPESLSFAFVNIITSRTETYTVGLHVLGLPDLQMRPDEIGDDGSVMIEMIQYISSGEKKIGNGHIIADLNGPRFRVSAVQDNKIPKHSPMHNPWGRLRLTSIKEISERN
ncbi:MAG: hypothetical protein JNL67_08685 [Planctomycetaceae bacterium]|nr:hypothetical protein [Planctomycetaceae bacterium]